MTWDPAVAAAYSTTFPSTETPISEGGIWLTGQRDATGWTNIKTAGGIAFGTQSGSAANFDDSVACLAGQYASFRADQYCEGTIHIGSPVGISEVTLGLRCTASAGQWLWYGTNFAFDGSYSFFGRWPGFATSNQNDYVTLAQNNSSPVGALQNGDIFQAQMIGFTFTTWILRGATRTQINTGTDTDAAKLRKGTPGFGTFNQGHAASNSIGFTRFFAQELL